MKLAKGVIRNTTLFKSKSTNRLGTPYLTVKELTYKDGSKYIYSQRAGINAIKFVLVDFANGLIGALVSRKPIGDIPNKNFISTFSGSLDKKEKTLEDILLEEIEEEAGYAREHLRYIQIGQFLMSSSSNEVGYLYLVDITTNVTATERKLEGGEKEHATVWIDNADDILNSTSGLLQTAYLHLLTKHNFKFKN